MKKIFFTAAALIFLWGCAGPKGPGAPSTRRGAVVYSSRTYALGKIPDQEREQAFQDLLAAAQAVALSKHGGASEIGFSYSLAPKGAVYPFSEVEVSCLMQKADASQGEKLCSDFFNAVSSGLKSVITESK
ncbi:MAG: hypothetical protein A2270_09915 [Elusimicrobia bacterium RIFOXYA12_FULL_51_18]|nr:MAG: hypothetical protein A2270_09915 [Elusimicrobia bacterium RIFOXYA12_FULL_51_18]OGS32395.1 MAG: hypothetical protein A2218_02225 [Elusimicrobia bacterium RIFOXYA2_FULL_53_38]